MRFRDHWQIHPLNFAGWVKLVKVFLAFTSKVVVVQVPVGQVVVGFKQGGVIQVANVVLLAPSGSPAFGFLKRGELRGRLTGPHSN